MTTALVLSGGGFKGFIHIGVIDFIIKNNIKIDLIIGTSMGSIIGAYYATHQEIDGIKKIIDKPNLKMLFEYVELNNFKKSLLKMDKIEKNFQKILGDPDFKDCKIPLFINATNLKTGKEQVFTEGKIIPAVKASICIPGVFEPVKIGSDYFVDGGCIDVLPETIAEQHNADKIIASLVTANPNSNFVEQEYLNELLKAQHFLQTHKNSKIAKEAQIFKDKDPENLFITMIETINCIAPQSLELIKKNINKNIILLTPNTSDIKWYDYKKANILIKRGFEEAEKKIPKDF